MQVSLAALGLYFWLSLWTPVLSADDQVPVSAQELVPPSHRYQTARTLQGVGLNRTVDLVCVQARLSEISQVFIEISGYPLTDT